MSGTVKGGIKTREHHMAKDPDWYKKIGRLGGLRKVPKGFAKNKELASVYGKLGGHKSKRGKANV